MIGLFSFFFFKKVIKKRRYIRWVQDKKTRTTNNIIREIGLKSLSAQLLKTLYLLGVE